MKKILLSIVATIISFSLFGIDGLIVKTTDYSFQEKWYKTISSTAPELSTSETVYKGQIFYLTAIAWDFKIDENGSADIQYAVKIIKPDGSSYFDNENLPLFKGKVASNDLLQMSEAILEISFEDKEQFGKYLIEIQIIDRNSSSTKQVNTSIDLKELPSYSALEITEENEFLNWFEKYYESPNPETALSYYLYYTQSPLSEDDNSFLPIFSIFVEIFKNNKFLYPQLLNCYKDQDDRTKVFLIYLLHHSDLGTKEFYDTLDGLEGEMYEEVKNGSIPDIYGVIKEPAQLDMLWSTFSTSGSYKPILKLIQTMDYVKFKGDLDEYENSAKTAEDRQKAINNTIYDALIWSFKSNCEKHKLVKAYADWALEHEKLSDVQKSELKKVLDEL